MNKILLLLLLSKNLFFSAAEKKTVLFEEINSNQDINRRHRRRLPCKKRGNENDENLNIIETEGNLRTMVDESNTLSELESWLSSTVSESTTMVGISAFLLAGEESNIHTVTAGNSVLNRAWDTKKKKVIKETAKQVTEDTSFMIASVSKTIVWTAFSMIHDAGLFQLDDSIQPVLPFKVRNPRFPKIPITYRMLYAHTSGIKDSWGGYKYDAQCPLNKPYPADLSTAVSKGVKKKSKWYSVKPGAKYNYANYGTALAGLLVERHSGMELTKFIKSYIFDPLDMKASQFIRPNDGSAAELYTYFKGNPPYDVASGGYCYPDWPSGQLWTTAHDLGKFARVMLNYGFIGDDKCLYSEETGKKVLTEKISPTTGDGDSGYGWFIGKPAYTDGAGHDGSETGVSSELYLHLSSGVAIGWLANGELKYNEYKLLTQKLLTEAKSLGGITPSSGTCNKTWMSVCKDDESFVFNGNRNCKWVGKSLKNIKRFCKKQMSGKFIRDWCPLSCTNC